MKVLVLAGVSYNTMVYVDRFPQPGSQTVHAEGFHETVGSTGAGKALNLHRLGFDVTLHGLIGDDEYGAKVRAYFEKLQIRCLFDIDPVGTKRHVNLMDPAGGRISIFLEGGSPEPKFDRARLEPLIHESDLVMLNIVNYARFLIPEITRAGKEVWCDIHRYDGESAYHQAFIDAADVIQLSSDSLPVCRPLMERLVQRGKELVVCTHGRDGATAFAEDGEWIEVPILPGYERVDTNGAGDAFFSGVLLGKARGCDLQTCMRLGAVVSGLCVTSRELAYEGLTPGLVAEEYERHYGETL